MEFKKILGVLFVFLFLISFVYAQDYSLYSGKFYDLREGQEKIEFEFYNGTYDICENEEKTAPILIVNKASVDNKYTLSSGGVSWIKLNVGQFSLAKKQSGVVFLELNPEQNSRGNYYIQVTGISSIGNLKRDIILNVKVDKCFSLKLELDKEEDKACGGIKNQYRGEILNDGKQQIDVELSVNAPNWVNLEGSSFSIAPNDKEEFELNADIPSNAKGAFNVIISATAKNFPPIKSEKKLSIEVVPKYDCYKAEVISDEKIKNYYSNEYIPIKIRNNGIKRANYEIVLEAPSWVSIEPEKLTANPEQIGSLNINVNPDAEVPEGNYPIKINVKLEDIVYSKNIDVILSKNQFFQNLKLFFIFYQYYIYVILFIAIILLVFWRQISNKIKTSYKNHKVRQARLQALEKARKARQIKIQIKKLEKAQLEVKKINKFRTKWILFFILMIAAASILFFSIYQFDFPISKNLFKNYSLYFISGILISLFVIFLIEFYKPLFRLLKKYK